MDGVVSFILVAAIAALSSSVVKSNCYVFSLCLAGAAEV